MNMKILEVQIVKTKSEKVKARADIHFDGFELKGFKVIVDENGKEFVTPPSYLSPKGWRALFKTDNPEDWQEIQRRVLETFNNIQIAEFAEETFGKKDTN